MPGAGFGAPPPPPGVVPSLKLEVKPPTRPREGVQQSGAIKLGNTNNRPPSCAAPANAAPRSRGLDELLDSALDSLGGGFVAAGRAAARAPPHPRPAARGALLLLAAAASVLFAAQLLWALPLSAAVRLLLPRDPRAPPRPQRLRFEALRVVLVGGADATTVALAASACGAARVSLVAPHGDALGAAEEELQDRAEEAETSEGRADGWAEEQVSSFAIDGPAGPRCAIRRNSRRNSAQFSELAYPPPAAQACFDGVQNALESTSQPRIDVHANNPASMAEGGVHVMIVCADELATAMAAADRSGDAAKAPMLSTVWAVRALTCALQRGGLQHQQGRVLLVGDATDDDDDDGWRRRRRRRRGRERRARVGVGVAAARARRRRAGGGGAGVGGGGGSGSTALRRLGASLAAELSQYGIPVSLAIAPRGVLALGSAGGGASRGSPLLAESSVGSAGTAVSSSSIASSASPKSPASPSPQRWRQPAAARFATRALDAMARGDAIVAPAGGRAPRRTPAVGDALVAVFTAPAVALADLIAALWKDRVSHAADLSRERCCACVGRGGPAAGFRPLEA